MQNLYTPRKTKLYGIFCLVFFAALAFALAAAVLGNARSFYPFPAWALLALGTAGALLWRVAWRVVRGLPAVLARYERPAAAGLLVLLFLLQVFAIGQIGVAPDRSWDFGLVYLYAEEYVATGVYAAGNYWDGQGYFTLFQNNAGLYAFWVCLLRFLQTMGCPYTVFRAAATAVNLAAINAALALTYLCARFALGRRRALFALLAAFTACPFITYASVYYTDTLSLPFPVAVVLLWLYARRAALSGKKRQALLLLCLLSLLAALGALLKVTVLIAWVAVAIDALLCRPRRLWPGLLAGAGIIALVGVGFRLILRDAAFLPDYDPAHSIPFTHWLMMGLQGTGAYHDPDYKLTLSAPDLSARYVLTVEEIGGRLKRMGPLGFMRHLFFKAGYIFGDGTYWSPDSLRASPVRPSALHAVVLRGGKYVGVFAATAFSTAAGMLAAVASGAAKAARGGGHSLSFVRTALFGLIVFLLMWEAMPRYLVNFLPLFLLCAAAAMPGRRTERQRRKFWAQNP